MHPTRILVADDEPRYLLAVKTYLESQGYQVLTAWDGRTAVELAILEEPDLIMLDVRMPGLDGYEACRRIRSFSPAPIIMLTALAQESDKVKGLDLGADDYVTKPFSVGELLARVRAVLRRAGTSPEQPPQPVFEAGDVRVDFVQKQVFIRGQQVDLTPTEYRLLRELVKSAGRVLVPDYLVERVWGGEPGPQNRLLRQAIHRLRHKIEANPQEPQYILTRRGIGYVFSPPDQS
jgi:DNA-binding response OmpR family regulator